MSEAPITDADREHWAFAPLLPPELPDVKDEGKWARTPVDQFVLAKLEEKGIAPQAEANWDTLVRRLSFDLTGLPPDRGAGVPPAEYGNGTRSVPTTYYSPDEYERLVDRLLASPAYGERWAQHWLDLARFADTDGFEHDKVRPEAWKYRDWVIAALNADLPYDEFVRMQIAGDMIQGSGFRVQDGRGQRSEVRGQEKENPKSEIQNRKSEIATMFCLAGPDMPDINSQEERRHYLLNEMTATVGSAFLGLQVGCAQCHDHKYDPISQADFYRLRAFFESAVELKKDASVSVLREQEKPVESRFWIRGDFRQPGALVSATFPRIANPQNDSPSAESPRLALANWLTRPDHPLTCRVMANRMWQHHFGRGIVETPSDFGILGSSPTHPELLDWLATELVRCGWSMKSIHRRIVTSSVYRQGGQVQSPKSEVQSDSPLRTVGSELYDHFPRRRLDGETIRDAMLAAAGLLDRQAGGPGVMPPLPKELTSTLLGGQWKDDPREANHYRRSIYLFARRNLRYPVFDTFDRPDANASCPARSVSTTALQSLQMVNSEFALHCARYLAGQAERSGFGVPGSGQQSVDRSQQSRQDKVVRWLVRRVFGREATEGEVQRLDKFLNNQTDLLRREGRDSVALALPINGDFFDPYAGAALVDLCLALFNASEFVYVD
ncbi:MAG TPA: DUF1549 and DUF1553 domain-containing protein [Pirellulaceae bacterium]|nr:DUF1549 and DUF1553 domain-containing protein [Pirellulaceae bacterium]